MARLFSVHSERRNTDADKEHLKVVISCARSFFVLMLSMSSSTALFMSASVLSSLMPRCLQVTQQLSTVVPVNFIGG